MSRKDTTEVGSLRRVAANPLSRRRFFAVSGGTGAAVLIAACGDDEEETNGEETTSGGMGDNPFGEGDLGIVNYALTLEYLEADFYSQVIDSGLFKGGDLDLIKSIGADEQAHVEALEATAKQLGEPAARPETKFPLESAEAVLQLAATVENLGAAAYLGAAGGIENDDILAAALSIHSNEGRHAAVLNTLIGESFTPDGAFAVPASMDEVLPAVQDFIVS